MSCHTVLGRLSFYFIIVTFNSAQNTASGSRVKTILGKTFAGGSTPVNACSVEPESVFKFNKNEYSPRTNNTQRFHTVLISEICP